VKGIYRPLVTVVGRNKTYPLAHLPGASRQSMNPFIIFTYPDVVIALLFTGVIYSVNYSIMASISSSFSDVYPWLSETILGVCYLPTGLGMIIGTQITGRMLDWEYAKLKRKQNGGPFPKEYARLRTMPLHLVIFVFTVIGWGLALGMNAHIAVPLVLSSICKSNPRARVREMFHLLTYTVGWCGMAVLNTTMTLMIDVLQSRSSGAAACVSATE
jgi:predicted MFS family arabinose efflux permease